MNEIPSSGQIATPPIPKVMVRPRAGIAVLPVAGMPGNDGKDGSSAPAPQDPVLLFDSILAGHE